MQRLIFRTAALLLCLLLAACAGRMPKPQVELPPLRLAPASLPTPLALQQQLHFRFGTHERDLDALLEADAQQVQLAVQAMGQTMALTATRCGARTRNWTSTCRLTSARNRRKP